MSSRAILCASLAVGAADSSTAEAAGFSASTSTAAGAAVALARVDERVELFQQITATNTEDLVHVREAALAKQPHHGQWTARSRTFVFAWDLIAEDPRRLAMLPLQMTLFDGLVCVPVTRSIELVYGEHRAWRAVCEGTGITIRLVLRPSDHTFSGAAHIPEGRYPEATISSIAPQWGVIYQIDPARVPPEYHGAPR